MIFTPKESNIIYNDLYDWMARHTPGSRCYKSLLKNYQKAVWEPVIRNINELSNKSNLTKEEKEFLKLVAYNGPIFRIQNYNSKYKGYVCESDFYQSWSSDIDGVSKVANLGGTVVLIIGNAINGINIWGLLVYLFNYKEINIGPFKNPDGLCIYEKEKEITYPIRAENIKDILTIEKSKLYDWENCGKSIPKSKWLRKSMN